MSLTAVFIETSFDAAHRLPNVPETHKCSNLHGHTYRVRVEISGAVDPVSGWIVDYSVVKDALDPIIERLDNKFLNIVDGLENPTCENILKYIVSGLRPRFPGLNRVELRETERCGSVWRQ